MNIKNCCWRQQQPRTIFLYVVLNAVTQPELHIIQNPAERTNPEEKIEARYMVSLDEIREKGAEYSKESRGL